jgi:hypothetical protein
LASAVREDTASGGRSAPAAIYSDHRLSLQDDGMVQQADGGVLFEAMVK